MSGRPDIALALYDRRMNPPEPEDWDPCPGAEAEREFYDAEDGFPCPTCKEPKGTRLRGCWLCCGDYGPYYRLTPADFQPGGRHFDWKE